MINTTGSTIVLGTSADDFMAEIIGVDFSGFSRVVLEKSHLGTEDAHEYEPGDLYDPGELRLRLLFDANGAVPMATEELVTCTWSDDSTWTFDGFVTDYSFNGELEGRMEAEVTIKISGEISI